MGWLWNSSPKAIDEKSSEPTVPAQLTTPAPAPSNEPDDKPVSNPDPSLHDILYNGAEQAQPQRKLPDTSLYPSTMSCAAAFDAAYYCASLGGKFNDIYRYGELKPCSEHWAQWRFCMGLKVLGPEAKKQKIREFYQQKEAKTKVGRNSENVWRTRGPGEVVEKYMWKDPDTGEANERL